jgi:hypothetical protein
MERTPQNSPPGGGIVPMQITPLRNNSLITPKERLRRAFKDSLDEENKKKIDHLNHLLGGFSKDHDGEWNELFILLRARWNLCFDMDPSPFEGYEKLYEMFGVKWDIYVIPYIRKRSCEVFNGSQMDPFVNLLGATVLGIWCLQKCSYDDGYLFYMSLNTQEGDSLLNAFFNWFAQKVLDEKKELSEWLSRVQISDYMACYILQITLVEEYAFYQMGGFMTHKESRTQFYDRCYEAISITRVAETLIIIGKSGRLSAQDLIFCAIKKLPGGAPIDVFFSMEEETFMWGELKGSDTLLKLDLLRTWELAVVYLCHISPIWRPSCLKYLSVLLRFFLFHTYESFVAWGETQKGRKCLKAD